MIAGWAGISAAENGLAIDCPFSEAEPLLAEWWNRGHALGRRAPMPRDTLHHIPRFRGATMAVHSAVND